MEIQEQELYPRQPRKPRKEESSQEDPQEKLRREAAVVQAQSLRDLRLSPGWEVLSRIFDHVMAEAAREVDTKEGVEVYRAQGKKLALRQINELVNQVLERLEEEEHGEEES